MVADDLLADVVGNLLTNAVEHGDHEPTIRVDTTVEANQVTIRIGDDGPGIPDEKRDAIFERGRTGLERMLLGSVTERVLRRSPVPVFVVKPDRKSLLPPH